MSVDPLTFSTIVNVRNIDEGVTNEFLQEMFSKYGTVTSCRVMHSGHVGRFAYVAFEDPDAAEEAIIELNGQKFADGQRIFLRRTHEKWFRPPKSKKKAESASITNTHRCEIFVKHLDPSMNKENLRSVFEHCGTITSTKVIMEDGRSKCYGFVSFTTPQEANRAVELMHGRIVMAKSLHVDVASGTDHSKNSRTLFSLRNHTGREPAASTSRFNRAKSPQPESSNVYSRQATSLSWRRTETTRQRRDSWDDDFIYGHVTDWDEDY